MQSTFEKHILPLVTSDRFFGVCMRLARNPADAEDLMADAQVRAFRFADRLEYRSDGETWAWVLTIARNTWFNTLQRRERERRAMTVASNEDGSWAPEIETMLDDKREWSEVERDIARLQPRRRELVRRFYLRDEPLTEAADAMGIPRGTALSGKFRALSELRQAAL